MSHPLKAVKDLISNGTLHQQLEGTLKKWPLLHFTEHAESILQQGFVFGESVPHRLDFTYESSGEHKTHPGPGYNFAFNALSWDIENDMHEFEVSTPQSGRSLMGMYGSSAILFLGDGLHTRHYDEFHQVIIWGQDARLGNALHLKNIGEQIEDDEPVCDEHGEVVDCWIILGPDGVQIDGPEPYLSLRDCVVTALHHYHGEGMLSAKTSRELAEVYELELQELGLEVSVSRKAHSIEAGLEP